MTFSRSVARTRGAGLGRARVIGAEAMSGWMHGGMLCIEPLVDELVAQQQLAAIAANALRKLERWKP